MRIPNSKFQILSWQKGTSLYFALMIMTVFLSIGLGISVIIFSQMKVIKGMEDSVISFYAADTGIEQALYKLYTEGASLPFSINGYLDLNNDGSQNSDEPTYSVSAVASGESCSSTYYCIKSTGFYKGTQRAIEIKG